MGNGRALLALRGLCPTRLSALRGISKSSGLTFPTGEAGILGEARSQLCLTAGQLPVSYTITRRARRLLPSTGSSGSFAKKLHPPEFSLTCKHLCWLCYAIIPGLMLEGKILNKLKRQMREGGFTWVFL